MGFYDYAGNAITMDAWMELMKDESSRHLAQTTVGDVFISTIWLGIDHNYADEGPPLIFETMVFGRDGYESAMERYATLDEAYAGHEMHMMAVEQGENYE